MSFGLEMTFLSFVGISLHASLLLNHIFCQKHRKQDTHTHSLPISLTHTLSQAYLYLLSLSLTHSLTRTRTHTHTHKLTSLFSDTLSLPIYLYLCYTQKSNHTPNIPHSLSNSFKHTSLSLSLLHTHAHAMEGDKPADGHSLIDVI